MNSLTEPDNAPRETTGGWRRFLVGLVSTTLGVMLADFLLPGIGHQAFTDLVMVALLLGLVNAFIRPVLLLLTLPFVLLTVGIGFLIINALLLWMVSGIVPGFQIAGFWSAFFGGMIISATSSIAGSFLGGGARVHINRTPRPRRPVGGDRRDPPGGSGPVIDV